jgi:hypothetical protein
VQPPALLEVRRLDVLDEVAVQRPGAADQHIDRSERADHLIDRARAFAGVGQVGRHDVRLAADLLGRRTERRVIARDQADAGAEPREVLRARQADPARSSRDQHRLSVEP